MAKGESTNQKLGRQKSIATRRKRYGPEFYYQIGHKGGSTTRKRYGHEFYVNMGKKGGGTMKMLMALGRQAFENDARIRAAKKKSKKTK